MNWHVDGGWSVLKVVVVEVFGNQSSDKEAELLEPHLGPAKFRGVGVEIAKPLNDIESGALLALPESLWVHTIVWYGKMQLCCIRVSGPTASRGIEGRLMVDAGYITFALQTASNSPFAWIERISKHSLSLSQELNDAKHSRDEGRCRSS